MKKQIIAAVLFILTIISFMYGIAQAADNFPARPVDIVVPWGIGGGLDRMSRMAAPLLEKNLGKKAEINFNPPQPGDVPITYADIAKARNELDYKPSVDIEEGVKKFVEWHRNIGLI